MTPDEAHFSDFSPRPAESALFSGQSASVLANFEVLKRFKRVSEVAKAFFEVKRPKSGFHGLVSKIACICTVREKGEKQGFFDLFLQKRAERQLSSLKTS